MDDNTNYYALFFRTVLSIDAAYRDTEFQKNLEIYLFFQISKPFSLKS